MKPFKNRLLIKPIETKSLLLQSESKYQQIGEVIEVGWRPWYMFWKSHFANKGDKVVFNIWGVDFITIDEQEYCFIQENEDFLLGKCN